MRPATSGINIMVPLIVFLTFLWACDRAREREGPPGGRPQTGQVAGEKGKAMSEKITKTDEEWRRLLTPEQYMVTRQHGTEPAFTGKYHDFKGAGNYLCVCCGSALFSSGAKYDSGTGWPSFWAPIDAARIEETIDKRYGMIRTEISCSRCGAHLGHVFEDGPRPTGLRYCINSAALDFREKE